MHICTVGTYIVCTLYGSCHGGYRDVNTDCIPPIYPAQGTHPETVLHCNVEGMVEPLLLVLSAQVHGLAVSYAVKERG